MLDITEVRIKLIGNDDRLRGFASLTIGDAVAIKDIKIIERGGGLFVAMPSRKLCDHCPACNEKNSVRARYCNGCGGSLRSDRAGTDDRGWPRLYADIVHPINRPSRSFLETAILTAYESELQASRQDGYVPARFDDMDYNG